MDGNGSNATSFDPVDEPADEFDPAAVLRALAADDAEPDHRRPPPPAPDLESALAAAFALVGETREQAHAMALEGEVTDASEAGTGIEAPAEGAAPAETDAAAGMRPVDPPADAELADAGLADVELADAGPADAELAEAKPADEQLADAVPAASETVPETVSGTVRARAEAPPEQAREAAPPAGDGVRSWTPAALAWEGRVDEFRFDAAAPDARRAEPPAPAEDPREPAEHVAAEIAQEALAGDHAPSDIGRTAAVPLFPPIAALNTPGRKPRIALMGEFSAGKSTLTNFLIGGDPLPVKVTATQLPPVWISWGSGQAYREDVDGRTHPMELGRLDGIRPSETRMIRLFETADILELCDLIDMPGISDPNMSSEVWERVIGEADAVIWCTHATQAWRQSEASVWDMLAPRLRARSLLLVTRFDKITSENDRLRLLKRVRRETDGLFAGVHPISLTEAIAASEDPGLWETSGAAGFTAHLMELIGTLADAIDGRAAPEPQATATVRNTLAGLRADRGRPESVPATDRVQPRRVRPRSVRPETGTL